jgi:hypothetical protein
MLVVVDRLSVCFAVIRGIISMAHNGGDVGRFNGLHPLFRAVPLGLVGAHPHRLVKARRDFTKRTGISDASD